MAGLNRLIAVGLVVAANLSVVRADESTPASETEADATATDQLPAAALEVQRALGGPLADQFPTLTPQGPSASPWWQRFRGSLDAAAAAAPVALPAHVGGGSGTGPWPNWSMPAATPTVTPALAEATVFVQPPTPVAALRATALELDASANRLEDLALYEQADSLRSLAQRLREDVRRLRAEASPEPVAPPAAEEPAAPPIGVAPSSDPPRTPSGWSAPLDRRAARRLRSWGQAAGVAQPGADSADRADSAVELDERSVLVEPRAE